MKTPEFLTILEHQKLAPRDVLSKLRQKAEKDGDRVTPKAVLKYLVKKEYIPRDVAYQLLRTTLTVSANAESSILGFVPLPPSPPEQATPEKASASEKRREEAASSSRQNLKIDQLDEENSESSNIFDTGQPPPLPASASSASLASLSHKEKADAETEAVFDEVVKEPRRPSSPGKAKSRKKKKESSEWDSSLILYGGGGLLVLLLVGGVIYYLLNRESAEVILEQASDFFNGGSYTQAINQYEHFLDAFPNDAQASTAKVKLGIARLWKATTNTNDYVAALETAKNVLGNIEDEEEFRSAQRDLASLLPKITRALATQTEEATDLELAQQRVDQTRQALSLYMNTKYVPTEFRDELMLSEVDQALRRVERNREQSVDLTKTLADIDAALANHQISQAYDLRSELLEEHPALLRDEKLTEKVREISAAEASVVVFSEEPLSAVAGPRDTPVLASLTLAENSVSLPSEMEGIAAVRIGGAVYGLKASDGSLLWREYLGIDPRSTPVPLAGGDLLVSDRVHNELDRLDAATGKVKWRLALESEILQPVVEGNTAYVTEKAGRIHQVDLNSGNRVGLWQFGQPLATPPTVDTRADVLYVPGEHSSLYTVSLKDKKCLGVFYLGHRVSELEVPAVKILNKFIVAINTGVTTAELHVFSSGNDGMIQTEDTSRRLKGIVETQLVTKGRRLVSITNRGQVKVFEVVAAEGDKALSTIAEHDVNQEVTLSRFGLLQGSNLWIAGDKLNKLGILATGNRVRVRDLEHDFFGDTFDHPLIRQGGLIIHTRRPANQAGAIVAATNAEDGKIVWQTELGVPLAGEPVVDSEKGSISALTATGAAFQLDRQAMARRVQDKSNRLLTSRRNLPTFQSCVNLQNGRLAAGEIGRNVVLHYRPDAPRGPVSKINLAGPLAADLVAWREGFVAPTTVGQLYYFRGDGTQLGSPFQPALTAGQTIAWQAPAVVDEGSSALLIATDGIEKLYLLDFVASPEPHLEATKEQTLEGVTLQTRLAATPELVVSGTKDGGLACFSLPELQARETLNIGGAITWGPYAVPSGVLLATDAGEMVFVTTEGRIGWRSPLNGRTPVGRPLADEAAVLVAWQLQGISELSLTDGSEQRSVALEQALAAGVVDFGKRLVAVAADGTLLVLNRP